MSLWQVWFQALYEFNPRPVRRIRFDDPVPPDDSHGVLDAAAEHEHTAGRERTVCRDPHSPAADVDDVGFDIFDPLAAVGAGGPVDNGFSHRFSLMVSSIAFRDEGNFT